MDIRLNLTSKIFKNVLNDTYIFDDNIIIVCIKIHSYVNSKHITNQ